MTYYAPTGAPAAQLRGISSAIRNEFQLIASAFTSAAGDITARGLIAGQTWTGTHDFTGGSIKVPTLAYGSSGNYAVSWDALNAVVFSAANLPGQSGKADYLLTTDGGTPGVPSWTNALKASVIRFKDGTDATKLLAFSVAGVTTGNMRTAYVPDRDFSLGGIANIIVITTTQTWQPPPGVTRVKRTIVDGGNSGGTSNSGPSNGGQGGNASVAYITVNPAVTYTATIGAAGVAAGAGTNTSQSAGGATSLSGTGLTTQTSANGDLIIPGGQPPVAAISGGLAPYLGGASLLATNSSGVGNGYGGGGAGAAQGAAGNNGSKGAMIIEY